MTPRRPVLILALITALLIAVGCAHPVDRTLRAQQQEAENQANDYTSSQSQPDRYSRADSLTEYPSLRGAVQGVQARPGDVALIVAIEEYPFLPNVDGARETAHDWEDFFLDTLQIDEVYTLIDEDASREDISDYLDMVAGDIAPDGRLWFVFVGHGAPGPDGDDGLLVGMDARQSMSSLQARSVPRSQAIDQLSQGTAAEVVVILDTCFSGQAPDGQALVAGAQPVIPLQDDLREPQNSSTVVLAASRNDQLAGPLPGLTRPSFSYLLLGAMRGWAVDGGGDVTAAGAQRFVDRQLRHVSDRRQNPQLQGPSDLVLVANATETSPDLRGLLSGRSRVDDRPASQRETSQRQTVQRPASASTSQQSGRILLPRGLELDLEDEWTITNFSEDGPDHATWHLEGYGGEIMILYMGGKGTYFERNAETMSNAYIDTLGVRLVERHDNVDVPPHSGPLHVFHGPIAHNKADGNHAAFYVRNGRDMWLFLHVIPDDHPDFDAGVQRFTWLMATVRFR